VAIVVQITACEMLRLQEKLRRMCDHLRAARLELTVAEGAEDFDAGSGVADFPWNSAVSRTRSSRPSESRSAIYGTRVTGDVEDVDDAVRPLQLQLACTHESRAVVHEDRTHFDQIVEATPLDLRSGVELSEDGHSGEKEDCGVSTGFLLLTGALH
jgi:hypothetical protein